MLPDSLGPHSLVQTGVDADVGRAHLLHGELADFLDGAWGSLLEGAAGQKISFKEQVHSCISNLINRYEQFSYCHFINRRVHV